MKIHHNKKLFWTIIVLIFLLISIYYYIGQLKKIDSFEKCAEANGAVMESYPKQCTFNGKTYIEEIEAKKYCTPESREGDTCITLYDPVCGYFADQTKDTYSNSCFACLDQEVEYWIAEECEE